jgi:hypothetical protein
VVKSTGNEFFTRVIRQLSLSASNASNIDAVFMCATPIVTTGVFMARIAVLCVMTFTWCFEVSAQSVNRIGPTSNQNIEASEIRFCDKFPGGTAGAKIAACIADIPATGGVADATSLQGPQLVNSNLDIGNPSKPVRLLLGVATYTLNSASLILHTGSHIVGSGSGRDSGKATTIRRTSGTTPMVRAAGQNGDHVRGFSLRRLRIDGGNAGGDGIVLRYVDTFQLDDLHMTNGGGSSALRLLDEAWDFWVVNSSFTVWGDREHATVELAGLNATTVVTDGHWYGNQLGELGHDNPILLTNPFVLQQRFLDNKFHITGAGMPYMVDWSGYRSAFVNCSFQADSVSVAKGLVRIKNADNQILGGHFTDINYGDAIHVSGSGDLIVSGVTFRSAGSPGPGSAIVTETNSTGRITAVANDIVNLTVGYDFREGKPNVILGPTNFSGTKIDVAAGDGKGAWGEYNSGKMTATFGGANLPGPRSAKVLNPTVRIGGSTAENSAGYQSLYLYPQFSERGQVNELLGMGSSWLAGLGAVAGTNVEHPFTWCYDSDATGDCFSVYRKSLGAALTSVGRLASITTSGDFRFQHSRGQHLQNQAAESDTAGRAVLNSQGSFTLKFAKAWTVSPVCVASDTSPDPGTIRVHSTTAELTLFGRAGHAVNYICMGNPD